MNQTSVQITLSPVLERVLVEKSLNTNNNKIDITSLASINNVVLPILPSCESNEKEIIEEHDAEPIKDIRDIIRISEYFIANSQYRNNMLFVVGINTGLRCSDLRQLRFKDIISNTNQFKNELVILEQKTKGTRKHPINRHIVINDAVKQAVLLYLQNTTCSLDDYMFRSESNNGKAANKPMERRSIERILKTAVQELGINVRAGTHSLRKTFSYHVIMRAKDRSRALELLQKILGHSSSSITLRYAGITGDEISDAYCNLNLGLNVMQV